MVSLTTQNYQSGLLSLKVSAPSRFFNYFKQAYPFFSSADSPSVVPTIEIDLQVELTSPGKASEAISSFSVKDEETISVKISEESLIAESVDWVQVLQLPLRKKLVPHGFFSMHTATVLHNNTLYFVIGNSMAGKSTISSLLASDGGSLYNDDFCFVRLASQEIQLIPLPRAVSVRNVELKDHLKNLNSNKLSPVQNLHGVNTVLLYPIFSENSEASLTSVSPASSLCTLLQLPVLVSSEAPKAAAKQTAAGFSFYSKLCKLASSYEIRYHDQNLPDVLKLIHTNCS